MGYINWMYKCFGVDLASMYYIQRPGLYWVWFEGLPGDWRFELSPNGWASGEIGLRWLQKHFIPSTVTRTKEKYRLLILDGHGSHLTPKFDETCSQNNIIPIFTPAHSSHLLQPLNISCFAVLKRSYGRLVETNLRLGINHIDKLDFLEAYPRARFEAFKPETIKNSFAAAGLVPFNPERLLPKLNIRLHMPTPPVSRGSESSRNFTAETSQMLEQLHQQASSIRTLFKKRSQGPLSPTDHVLNQLVKGCQLMIQSTTSLAKERNKLRAANKKPKQKRIRYERQIPCNDDLSVPEAHELIDAPIEALIAPANPPPRAKTAFATFAAAYEGFAEVWFMWKSGT